MGIQRGHLKKKKLAPVTSVPPNQRKEIINVPTRPPGCPDPSLQCSALCIFLDLTLGQDIYLFVSYSFQNINFQEDWKIITLFIGGNDLCDVCDDPVGLQALTQDSPRKDFHPGSLEQFSWVGTWLVVRQ